MTTNNGAGGLVAMRGRCESADFENDTLTFKMDGDYYAAAGEYVITPAALQAQGDAVATTCAAHQAGETGFCTFHSAVPWNTKLYTAPPSDVLRRVVERAAEEIEQGHTWISATAASAIIRKHILAAHKALAEGVDRDR